MKTSDKVLLAAAAFVLLSITAVVLFAGRVAGSRPGSSPVEATTGQ